MLQPGLGACYHSTHTGKPVSTYEKQSVSWVLDWTLASLWGSPSQNVAGWLGWAGPAGPPTALCIHPNALCTGVEEHWSSFSLKMYIKHVSGSYFKCFPPCFAHILKGVVMILSFLFRTRNKCSSRTRIGVIGLVAQ